MNGIDLGPSSCERVRQFLDSYLSNELINGTNHALSSHLKSCEGCAGELQARERVRLLLKNAVQREAAPDFLKERIQRKIRGKSKTPFLHMSGWAIAAAAALFMAVGGWWTIHQWNLGRSRAEQELANSVLKIGVDDHLTCAVNHEMSNRRFTFDRMARALGEDYFGLVPAVQEKVPEGYEIVVGHQCRVHNRPFVHLILKKQDSIISVVLTRKTGEAFPKRDLAKVMQTSGIRLFGSRLEGFEVAGFETRDHLAFVVSDRAARENLMIASNIAPSVRDYLARLEI